MYSGLSTGNFDLRQWRNTESRLAWLNGFKDWAPYDTADNLGLAWYRFDLGADSVGIKLNDWNTTRCAMTILACDYKSRDGMSEHNRPFYLRPTADIDYGFFNPSSPEGINECERMLKGLKAKLEGKGGAA